MTVDSLQLPTVNLLPLTYYLLLLTSSLLLITYYLLPITSSVLLSYNTKAEPVRLPEYGRNIQQMVDHCLQLPTREERTECAHGIIDTICRLNPQQRVNPEWRAKLWDHLAIMSGFALDIDWPVPLSVSPDELLSRPANLPINQNRIAKRAYGNIILRMIDQCTHMAPDSTERLEYALLTATHMKKLMLAINPEAATDQRIFDDLREMSKGAISLIPSEHRLRDFELAEIPAQQRKKRRRR